MKAVEGNKGMGMPGPGSRNSQSQGQKRHGYHNGGRGMNGWWMVPPTPQNAYVETLTPSMTVFGDGVRAGVTKVK